jgi:hypothetical protein
VKRPQRLGSGKPSISARNFADLSLSRADRIVWLKWMAMLISAHLCHLTDPDRLISGVFRPMNELVDRSVIKPILEDDIPLWRRLGVL